MTVLFQLDGDTDATGVTWRLGTLAETDVLLQRAHYLGPIRCGGAELVVVGDDERGDLVAAQVWRRPTSRNLPADGTWLELSRWCLTPAAGPNAGSRQHSKAVRLIREHLPAVTTLVSYSDPSAGHDGALYRACNWYWSPTWHRLRTPPTGNGAWQPGRVQAVKDRWIFNVRRDRRRAAVLNIDDPAAIRHWRTTATPAERRWADRHPQLGGAA